MLLGSPPPLCWDSRNVNVLFQKYFRPGVLAWVCFCGPSVAQNFAFWPQVTALMFPLTGRGFCLVVWEEGIIPETVSRMELCDPWARSRGEGLLYMAVEEGAHKSEQECLALHLVSCASTAGCENKIQHKAKSAKQDYKSLGR